MKSLIKLFLFLAAVMLVFGCSREVGVTLVKRGKTGYSIFLDPSASESARSAAEDLKSYFIKVTGASPGIIISAETPAPPFISLGNTAAARKAGLDASGIPIDGFRILTLDDNIFILGPDTPDGEVNSKGGVNKGTSNGVYTFIEDYLGVRWLMPGEIGEEYDETGTLRLPLIDRMEYSPFDYRVMPSRETSDPESLWDRRMKLDKVAPIEHHHNWVQTVPPPLFKKHPEWFAMKNGKRVPPIGGYYKLETTNQELVRYFADRVIEAFRKDPNRRWFSLSPSDGRGWSESPESMALTELDDKGDLSVTPLVLTFYNDVARLVKKEFPDHMLGGYIYNIFRYPPRAGLEIEPNLAFNIPNGHAYGFRLYRTATREEWGKNLWFPEWSELSRKHGFDIYYWDMPITHVNNNGIVCPPAPDLLNFTFDGMIKYGFKGAYFLGNGQWPVFGAGNYIIAKLFWDPEQDAHEILHDYCRAAYGPKAGEYMENLFQYLDSTYSSYYNYNLDYSIGWLLRNEHLEGIFAPSYPGIEEYYFKAMDVKKKPRQQERLKLFGQVLSLLQWNLRDLGFLPADYNSPLTLDNEEIDELLTSQDDECRITRKIPFKPEKLTVETMPALADAERTGASIVPVYAGDRGIQMLMHVPVNGEVTIHFEAFNKRAAFVQYIITDAEGEVIHAGAASEGRTISFNGKAGKNYFLNMPIYRASGQLKVDGAFIAYNSIYSRGFHLDGAYIDGALPLYFYVPGGLTNFNIILGQGSGVADLFSPDGRKIGQLNNIGTSASNILVSGKDVKEGFWKIVFHEVRGRCAILLDEQLPQWIMPDPASPLKISEY